MSEKSANYSYRVGLGLFKKGKLESALKQFNKALEILPYYSEVLANKGAVLTRLERYDEALEALNKALKSNPNLTSAIMNKNFVLEKLTTSTQSKFPIPKDPEKIQQLFDKAVQYFERGKFDEAIQFYDKILESDPVNHDALLNKGNALLHLGNYEHAIKTYDIFLDLNKNEPDAWYGKAVAYGKLFDYDSELKYLDKVLDFDPNHTWALHAKGTTYANTNKFKKALQYFDKALALDPSLSLTQQEREKVLKEINKTLERESHSIYFQKKEKKNQVEEYYGRGNDYASEGDFQKAIEFHQKAVELEPLFADGWINLGADYANINDIYSALKFFDKAIDLDPQNYRSWSNKGMVLFNQGWLEEALICYNEAFKLNSEDVQVKNNRGYITQELAKKKIKIEDDLLKQLEGIYPKSAIKEMVNEIEKKQRSMELLNTITGKNTPEKEDPKHKPEEHVHQVKKLNEGIIKEKLSIAEELIYDGEYDQVIQLCDEILGSDRTNPYAWFWKGKALTALARNKEAFQCYMNAKNMKNKGLLMNNMSISEKLLRSDKDRIERRKMRFPDDARPLFPNAKEWSTSGAYIQTMGKFEAALYCYNSALEINPNYKPALRNKKRIIILLEKEGMRK